MNDMRKLMEAVDLDEGASPEQWEIAINNLISEGDAMWDADTLVDSQRGVWRWVRKELHGMLDFQPENDDGGMGHESALGHNHKETYQNYPG